MRALNFPNAVTDPEDLFGRHDELELILSTFTSGARVPVIIVGERRIGKTSLHNAAIFLLKQRGFVPLSIEPRGIQSVNDFAHAVLVRLASHLEKDLASCGLVNGTGKISFEQPSQFEQAFQRLIGDTAGAEYLLCVDEFDEIMRRIPAAEQNRMLGLVHFLVEKSTLPLSLFIILTRLPDTTDSDLPLSLMVKSILIELHPLTAQGMAELIAGIYGAGLVIGERELKWLYDLSGGHPYFIKLILSFIEKHIPSSGGPLSVTEEMLTRALHSGVADARTAHALENIYRVQYSNNEKRVLLFLAEQDSSIHTAQLRQAGMPFLTAARTLVRRDYLEERNDRLDFRLQFLRYWLRNWVEFEEEVERLNVHQTAAEMDGLSSLEIIPGDPGWESSEG